MTLLVGLRAENGLVLAADSRGTFGDPRQVTAQNDSQQKAHVLASHVAVLQAGAGELGTNVLRRTRDALSGQIRLAPQQPVMPIPGAVAPPPVIEHQPPLIPPPQDGVTPVLGLLRDVTRASYHEWFPSVPPIPPPAAAMAGQIAQRPGLEFVVAGYELDGDGVGVGRIFTMSSALDFAPALHDYGFAVAGVPTYALYLLNRLYQPGRSVADLTALAVYVITETASQDGKVGGPVSVIQVTPEAGCATLAAGEVSQVMEDNATRSLALRDSFYQHGEADEAPVAEGGQAPDGGEDGEEGSPGDPGPDGGPGPDGAGVE